MEMSRTLIIAEAGVNHNGSLETAKKLNDTAKECGKKWNNRNAGFSCPNREYR